MHGTTLTEERELVEQPTTNYLPIGVSTFDDNACARVCKVEQPRMAHVPCDSNIHAAPMVSKERQNGEHPVMVRSVRFEHPRNADGQQRASKRQTPRHSPPSDWRFVPGAATVDPERAHCEANLKGSAAGGILGSQWMGVQDDRPPEARSAYAQLEATNAASVVNDAVNMRSTPVQSSARAGLQSTRRLDSMSLPSTPTPMLLTRDPYSRSVCADAFHDSGIRTVERFVGRRLCNKPKSAPRPGDRWFADPVSVACKSLPFYKTGFFVAHIHVMIQAAMWSAAISQFSC